MIEYEIVLYDRAKETHHEVRVFGYLFRMPRGIEGMYAVRSAEHEGMPRWEVDHVPTGLRVAVGIDRASAIQEARAMAIEKGPHAFTEAIEQAKELRKKWGLWQAHAITPVLV